MRGSDERTGELFSYVDLEKRVPAKHPLRLVRGVVNEVLAALDSDFSKAYADSGRPSIAPERLLRALLLQAFYTIRSERQLMEQLDYNLLYRWFVGLGVDEPVWVPTVFTKNRDRLLEADVARKFLAELLDHKQVRGLLVGRAFLGRRHADRGLGLDEELQGEGRLERSARLRAQWRARFPRREAQQRHACLDHGSRGASSIARARGKEAKLCFMGHALMENRNGLIVAATLTKATGTAERQAAEDDDRAPFARGSSHHPGRRQGLTTRPRSSPTCARFNVTPHIAQNISGRRSAIDARTTRHPGYAVSQQKRKRIEEPFGWGKTIGGLARPMLRGVKKLGFKFTLTMASYNLIRLPKPHPGHSMTRPSNTRHARKAINDAPQTPSSRPWKVRYSSEKCKFQQPARLIARSDFSTHAQRTDNASSPSARRTDRSSGSRPAAAVQGPRASSAGRSWGGPPDAGSATAGQRQTAVVTDSTAYGRTSTCPVAVGRSEYGGAIQSGMPLLTVFLLLWIRA